jgi:hypothetical protein
MRSTLFWDIAQRMLVITDVSGQPISPIFNGHEIEYSVHPLSCIWYGDVVFVGWLIAFDLWTLVDGTDRLPQNVGKEEPPYTA